MAHPQLLQHATPPAGRHTPPAQTMHCGRPAPLPAQADAWNDASRAVAQQPGSDLVTAARLSAAWTWC